MEICSTYVHIYMYTYLMAQESQASTFDVDKELEEVNKRLREQTARQMMTPGGRSPELKRLRSQAALSEGDEKARSGSMEDKLMGLPEEEFKKQAEAATPQNAAPSSTPCMGPPSKLPSPAKPVVVPSPRNLMPQLDDVEKDQAPEASCPF